jgi:hypothetical protein
MQKVKKKIITNNIYLDNYYLACEACQRIILLLYYFILRTQNEKEKLF